MHMRSLHRSMICFQDNIPYEEWADYLKSLLNEYGVKDGLVLDLGCGTGSITELTGKGRI